MKPPETTSPSPRWPRNSQFDATIITVVEHAIVYAFRIGYRTRVGEEGAEEKVPS